MLISTLIMHSFQLHLFGYHGIEHFGIQHIFSLSFHSDFRSICPKEIGSLFITFQSFIHWDYLFLYILLCIRIPGVINRTYGICQASISDQYFPAVSTFLQDMEFAFTDMFFIVCLTHNATLYKFIKCYT